MGGPLEGLRVIELAGIGPGPFACMMLADHGAEVIRVERSGGRAGPGDPARDVLLRSRRIVRLDLKSDEGVEAVRDLAATADGLVEGFRPGVAERLGLGPDKLIGRNPRLCYGRMTGWGQDGPWAQAAGHDINYIAVAGALHGLGRAGEKPTPPINLVGDFGGGGMLLAFGMVAAMLHAKSTGRGQVVDCAMTDGAALLMSMMWSFRAMGFWRDERGVNLLDTGAHFYDTYQCADGKHVAVGAIEPQFYALLRDKAGLTDPAFDRQMDPRGWPDLKERMAAVFRTRTRDEWCALTEGTDACVAPVLSMAEAPRHPHNAARGTFIEADGVKQPAPAPRFSETPAARPRMTGGTDETAAILAGLGYPAGKVERVRGGGGRG